MGGHRRKGHFSQKWKKKNVSFIADRGAEGEQRKLGKTIG
jgi:hypothetical protein